MPIRLTPQAIENMQQLQAAIAGPDGATRMFVITGILQAGVNAFSQSVQQAQQTQTFTVLVGPQLSRRQFVQAVATAAIVRTSLAMQAQPMQLSSSINGVDADWDDESGQVQLEVELSCSVSGINNNFQVQGIAFHVTILAALDQQ